MKIGFKKVMSNHRPKAQCFPNLPGILKKDMKSAITQSGGNKNDKTHHPDIHDTLNRRYML
jgi:hypothetical protein